ncbi:hypothetical protein H9Q72_007173 [Fusarium xylarioides]|uniref:Uncharacterized protein n=1 Tax=Fusarium xylarioides TaxID=221167 RepID=A0A9P7HQF4_9HYPO|nr:hypothetical protein H9Q72_007173 [Fusarium xylarioides]
MNGGSALNYLLLGFVNIWWMPTANILGRKLVFLATACLCLATGFWLAAIDGTVQWMLNMILTVGLISGGSMSDTVGWRWSQNIVGFIFVFVLIAFAFSFEETLFPRFLFAALQAAPLPIQKDEEAVEKSAEGKKLELGPVPSQPHGIVDDSPKRSYKQILKPWAAFIYAFGATAGIVSFNTISEILTEPPYNFSTTSTGLVFFAALVGDIIGWVPCFVFAAVEYMLYGWGAQTEAHWVTIAIGIDAMISHQVGACTIATAYAMDCFPGISGELVVVLAMCSSMVNFAISYSVQLFIEEAGYGWTMTCFGAMVLLSVLAAIPLVLFGKRWRIAKGPR